MKSMIFAAMIAAIAMAEKMIAAMSTIAGGIAPKIEHRSGIDLLGHVLGATIEIVDQGRYGVLVRKRWLPVARESAPTMILNHPAQPEQVCRWSQRTCPNGAVTDR